MKWSIPSYMAARSRNTWPNPNTFNFYRRGQPIIGLWSRVNNKSFDYYRRKQPPQANVVPS